MKLNMKDPGNVFGGVLVAALLILTAWGNAIALLAFSVIALAVWVAVPGLRRQIALRREVLAGAVSFALAAGIAIALTLTLNN